MSKLLLNLDEFIDHNEKSKRNRVELFDTILVKCHNKIKKYNKEFRKQECLFTPPKFVIGKPPYNYVDLLNYLIDSLKKNGLRTEWLAHKDAIYVSWKPVDLNIDQYHQHFPNVGYNDDFDQQLLEIPYVKTTQMKKKMAGKPVLQHVAMLEYGANTEDLIPINVKSVKSFR